jgi:hypothetical protein
MRPKLDVECPWPTVMLRHGFERLPCRGRGDGSKSRRVMLRPWIGKVRQGRTARGLHDKRTCRDAVEGFWESDGLREVIGEGGLATAAAEA